MRLHAERETERNMQTDSVETVNLWVRGITLADTQETSQYTEKLESRKVQQIKIYRTLASSVYLLNEFFEGRLKIKEWIQYS